MSFDQAHADALRELDSAAAQNRTLRHERDAARAEAEVLTGERDAALLEADRLRAVLLNCRLVTGQAIEQRRVEVEVLQGELRDADRLLDSVRLERDDAVSALGRVLEVLDLQETKHHVVRIDEVRAAIRPPDRAVT